MERKYTVKNNGITHSILVDKFKNKTNKFLKNNGLEDLTIRQRCYRDGRWEITVQTPYYPNIQLYYKKYKFMWTDDIEERLAEVLADYYSYKNRIDYEAKHNG